MKKQEALNYIREKMGYVPYIMLFDIYSEDDAIPKNIIEMSIKPLRQTASFMVCSSKVADMINELINENRN